MGKVFCCCPLAVLLTLTNGKRELRGCCGSLLKTRNMKDAVYYQECTEAATFPSSPFVGAQHKPTSPPTKKPFVVVVEALALAQYHAKGCHSLRGIFPFLRVGRWLWVRGTLCPPTGGDEVNTRKLLYPVLLSSTAMHTATRPKFFASVERNVE